MEGAVFKGNGSSAIVDAVGWLQGILVGTTASVIATISVAVIGLMMLGGHVPVRRGLSVIVGCFILFGASTIAIGIRDGIYMLAGEEQWTQPAPLSAQPPLPVTALPPARPMYDREQVPRHRGLQGEYQSDEAQSTAVPTPSADPAAPADPTE